MTVPEHRHGHAEAVAALVAACPRRPVLAGLDGRAGSGKTSLAAQVAALVPGCVVVHLDDLYPGWDGLAAAPTLLAEQVLTPLRAGRPGRYRRYDWERGEPAEAVVVPVAPVVLVEGCGATAAPARELLDVRIWLDAPADVRKARALARESDPFGPHWARWAAQEERLLARDRTPEHAHLVLRTAADPRP